MSRNEHGRLIGLKARKGFLEFIFWIIPGKPLVDNYLVIFLNCSMHFQTLKRKTESLIAIYMKKSQWELYFLDILVGKNSFSNLRGKLLGRML